MDPLSSLGLPPDGATRPRRRFLAEALGLGAGAAALGGLGRSATAQSTMINDIAILQFTLNLEYLAAEYATLGVTGSPIESLGIDTNGVNTGGGAPGPITVRANPRVTFTSDATAQLANELAVQERQHVVFVRKVLQSNGIRPVARPALDFQNSFNALAALAGFATPFDPFANEVSFLLGTFILEDTALTALHGAAPLIRNKSVLSSAAGLLGIEGYHSAVVRTSLFQMGQGVTTQAFANVRRTLGGSIDYGVVLGPLAEGPAGTPSIALADSNAVAPSRDFRQVLNIAYGGINAQAGGFFPQGFNGPIR